MSSFLGRYNIVIMLLFCINLGIIFSQDNTCTQIEHCQKCPEQNKCEECAIGYKLNEDKTKCESENTSNNPPAGSSPKKSSSAAQQASGSAKKSSAPQNASGSAQKSSAAASSPKKSSPAVQNASGSAKKSSSAVQNASGSAKKSSPAVQNASGSVKKSSPVLQNASGSVKKSSSQSQQNKPSGSSVKHSSQNLANTSVKKASNSPIASNKVINTPGDAQNLETEDKGIFHNIFLYLIAGCIILILTIYCCLKKRKSKSGYFYDESGNPEEKAKVVYIQ